MTHLIKFVYIDRVLYNIFSIYIYIHTHKYMHTHTCSIYFHNCVFYRTTKLRTTKPKISPFCFQTHTCNHIKNALRTKIHHPSPERQLNVNQCYALNWQCSISCLINGLEGNHFYVFQRWAVFVNYAAEETALFATNTSRCYSACNLASVTSQYSIYQTLVLAAP